MPIFLLYVFVKGPLWLRAFVLLCFAGLLLFACLITANNLHTALERQVPAHVPHAHKHPASFVRSSRRTR